MGKNPQLASFVERIVRLEEEKAELAADIRSVVEEAKTAGLNPRALKAAVKVKRMDEERRLAHQADCEAADQYVFDLGLIPTIGSITIKRAAEEARV